MRKILLSIFLIILFSGCTVNYCPQRETETSMREMGAIVIQFDSYANSNPFNIQMMQKSRSDMSSLKVPGCLERSKKLTLSAMDNIIVGSKHFLADNDNWSYYIGEGISQIKEAENEMSRIIACMPNCD